MIDSTAFRRALGLLFGGVLVVLLDIGINGVDLLLDPVGWLLVALALGQTRNVVDDAVARDRTTIAAALAWAAVAFSALGAFDALVAPLDLVGGLVGSVQPVVAAFALLRVAQVLGAPRLLRSWRTTIGALLATFVVTNTVLLLAAETETDDIDTLAVLAVAVFVAAFAHYLLSIHRTRAALA